MALPYCIALPSTLFCLLVALTSLLHPVSSIFVNSFAPPCRPIGNVYWNGLEEVTAIMPNNSHTTYPPDCDLTLFVHLRRKEGFNITITKLELEPPGSDGVCKDYLQLELNAQNGRTPITGRLCGNQTGAIEPIVKEKVNKFVIRFVSNAQNEYGGFRIHFDRLLPSDWKYGSDGGTNGGGNSGQSGTTGGATANTGSGIVVLIPLASLLYNLHLRIKIH